MFDSALSGIFGNMLLDTQLMLLKINNFEFELLLGIKVICHHPLTAQ